MVNYEVIVLGGGPAGLTAGLYTSRAGLRSLLIEQGIFGGQMVNARQVDNYPGFPEGISGFELGSLMHRQATRYGLETITADVTGSLRAGSSTDAMYFRTGTRAWPTRTSPSTRGVPSCWTA
jgi:thioredoxin reductase (NADPH)